MGRTETRTDKDCKNCNRIPNLIEPLEARNEAYAVSSCSLLSVRILTFSLDEEKIVETVLHDLPASFWIH